MRTLPCLALLVLVACPRADAAESYDNCAGTIAALPATITTQGVWCMKSDLATAMASGAAITVQANNVTIDCNGFKLGGLAAGEGTAAFGIYTDGRSNLTIRGCTIRGFFAGILMSDLGGGGHVVEDNRLDGNTAFGIAAHGDGSIVRRNQVLDTGGSTAVTLPVIAGIAGTGNIDVTDNTIRVVDASPRSGTEAFGVILQSADAASVSGNRIGGIVAGTHVDDDAFGIRVVSSHDVIVRGNDLSGGGARFGVACNAGDTGNAIRDNVAHAFQTGFFGCHDAGGNADTPP